MILYFFCAVCFLFLGCSRHHNAHRSPLRKPSCTLPTLVVSDRSGIPYTRTSSTYQKYPIFTVFDYNFFIEHQLPTSPITYADSSGTVPYDILNTILERVVDAITHKKKSIPGCTVIRDRNFNYHTGCGLLILKINQHPFVIKLFRETAESFINPYGKGLTPITFFFMAGGPTGILQD